MVDDYQAELVANIAATLLEKSWTAKDLAHAMGYDYDTTVKRWLRRQKAISLASLDRIARAVGKTVQELDPHGQAYNPENRPPHMRRGGTPAGGHRGVTEDMIEQLKEAQSSSRERLRPFLSEASSPDYLEAMALWWSELTPEDRERVHDIARQIRDERRAARRKAAG